MKQHNHDPNRDAGQTHAPPEDAVMDRHAFNAASAGEAGAGQSRRPPALTLEASQAKQKDWRTTKKQDREAPEPYPKSKEYRARMLQKVGNVPERGINFTDEELEGFIAHAEGLGFGQEDVEAILAVKVRKPEVKTATLMEVTDCLAKKSTVKSIRFKEGWDFMRAYRGAQEAMLSGNALAPEVYLADDYIKEHTKTFSGKASYLLPRENFDRFVSPESSNNEFLGYNAALYISSAAEIDRVLATAQGDISIVERLLGIPSGDWQRKGPQIYRVDIFNPETKGLRIPNGFEASANAFWTPGAITSGGTMEAVLDEVPRIEGVTYTCDKVIG